MEAEREQGRLVFKKENGFPANLEMETHPHYDDEQDWHGWKTIVFVDGHKFDTIIHSDHRTRVHYANGFMAAYRWESEGQYKWRGKENPTRENGDLNVEVGDWIVDKDGYIRRVDMDSDPDMPYEDIKRHASEVEVESMEEINKLLDYLSDMRDDHEHSWNTYGSELCAGEMSAKESRVEKQIEELRNVSKTKV